MAASHAHFSDLMWIHTIAKIEKHFFFEEDDLKHSSYAQKTVLVCVCWPYTVASFFFIQSIT